MSLLAKIHAANNADLNAYHPLFIGNELVGLIWDENIECLADYGVVLQTGAQGLIWQDKGSETANSAYLQAVCQRMYQDGLIHGWRDENYALASGFHQPPKALIERAAVPYFGACGYGVHVNGLTMKNGLIYTWIARRAKDKPTAPNKLDQVAAGGIPHGISVFDNMLKECQEEANIAPELAKQATAVGTVSYLYQSKTGIRSDVMFNYDLWLPPEFEPQNNDGEVAEFMCLPLAAAMELVAQSEQVKFNAALVIIDCCVRHGLLTPNHPDYQQICSLLSARESSLQAWLEKYPHNKKTR